MLGPDTFPIHKRLTDIHARARTHTHVCIHVDCIRDTNGWYRSKWLGNVCVCGTYTYCVDDLGVHNESKPECPGVRGIRKPDSSDKVSLRPPIMKKWPTPSHQRMPHAGNPCVYILVASFPPTLFSFQASEVIMAGGGG